MCGQVSGLKFHWNSLELAKMILVTNAHRQPKINESFQYFEFAEDFLIPTL